MAPKHQQADRDLLYSLADRIHHRAQEDKARGGYVPEADSSLLARARLRGWKPMEGRRAAKRAADLL